MPPKKTTPKPSAKKVSITIAEKKDIIKKFEDGARISDIARELGKAFSTIATIIKKRESIKAAETSKGVKFLTSTKKRPEIMNKMEKLLLVWINEKQLARDTISQAIICEKAKSIYADLLKQVAGTSEEEQVEFKASRGWFEKFRRRSGIHSVIRHGEAASADQAAADEFKIEFKRLVDSEGYLPQQVFNCDETGLFWKKMPRRTFITVEETKMPGHKPMKDRLTLLFCANASGDLKIKPLLVYHSETPRAFKRYRITKTNLSVMWRSNAKAWVTRVLFVEWINAVFGPAVKRYLQERGLPLKCLLVMDNAPAHPPGLEDDLLEEFRFIKVKFLPPNTTPILQPMDQQVISNFKKLYTKFLFRRCFDVTDATNLSLTEFWKQHFDIVSCLQLIDKAWGGVTRRTLNSAWRKLWPDAVPERDFEGFEGEAALPTQEEEDTVVEEEIVNLGRDLGLEVDEDDVADLIAEHADELTTEELSALEEEQREERSTEAVEEEEEEHQLSTAELKEMLGHWEKFSKVLQTHHPNKMNAVRSVNLLEENAVEHFRNMLKMRQKQSTIDRFFVKMPKRASSADESESAKRAKLASSDSSEPKPGPSGIQRPTQDVEVPPVLLEDDEDDNASSPPPS